MNLYAKLRLSSHTLLLGNVKKPCIYIFLRIVKSLLRKIMRSRNIPGRYDTAYPTGMTESHHKCHRRERRLVMATSQLPQLGCCLGR